MLKYLQQLKSSESVLPQSEHGSMLERLNRSEVLETTDLSISSHIVDQKKKNQKSLNTSTREYHQISKKQISKDKSSDSKKSTRITKSLRRSQVELTSKEKVLEALWTKQSKGWLEKLWLPTETGSVGLPGNTSVGCSNHVELISSFSINKNKAKQRNSTKTSLQSSMFSLAGTMEHAPDAELKKYQTKTVTRIPGTRTFTINPTKEQKIIIDDWIAAYRKTWNLSLKGIEHYGIDDYNWRIVRDRAVVVKHMSKKRLKKMEWTLRTPKRIREYGFKDLHASIKACKTNKRKGNIYQFTMHEKNKDDQCQTIMISKDNSRLIKFDGFFYLRMHKMDVRITGDLDNINIESNFRLQRENGIYRVFLTTWTGEPKKYERSKKRIVSVDPGENIPFVYYSPDGEWGEIGGNTTRRSGMKSVLKKLGKKRKQIEERMTGSKQCTATRKVSARIFDLVNDFQWKTAHWMLQHFETILIPRLYVNIGTNKTKQLQNDLKHCRFVDRLKYLSMWYGTTIHEVKEHYTSMACTRCRSLNTTSSDVVSCFDCGQKTHRDLNGARNILAKHLA